MRRVADARDFTAYTGADSGASPAAGTVVGAPFNIPDADNAFFHLIATVLGTTPSITLKLQTTVDPAANGANWIDYPNGAFGALTTSGAVGLLLQGLGASYFRTVVSASSGTTPRLNPTALYVHVKSQGGA